MAKIALIQSCWHKEIVDQFSKSFSSTIAENATRQLEIETFNAPGVVEIPLLAKKCANKKFGDSAYYSSIIVAGLIVDHGVYRHEFVANSVMDVIMKLQMESEIPIIYGILTAQDFMSEGRQAFYHEHFHGKGVQAAEACLKTLDNMDLF